MRKYLLAASLLTAPFLGLSAAHAGVVAQVEVGSSGFNAATVTETALNGNYDYTYVDPAGVFDVSGTVATTPFLTSPDTDTTATNVSSDGTAGTVTVELSVTGLTSPYGVWSALSGFTTNTFTGDVASVTETTYIDASDTPFGTSTELSSATFTAENEAVANITATPDLTGPFSETVEYAVTFAASDAESSANDTIDVSNVPEPASLALLGAGLAGLGLIRRRKNRNNNSTLAA